jgi:hypothetical protein
VPVPELIVIVVTVGMRWMDAGLHVSERAAPGCYWP